MHGNRFTIATDWTGKPHTFHVEVWPTREAMLSHLEEAVPYGDWRETNAAGETPAGAFVNAAGFQSDESPLNLGTIYYNEEHLDIDTLVHEVVHAAMFAWWCDKIGNYSLARVHMTMTNEPIAYMIGGLISQIASFLTEHGFYDLSPVPIEAS